MKPQSLHSHEDTLLDFAYGELPVAEMRAVEDHLAHCTHCTETLDNIRGVRSTMAQLKEAPAPDAGLDSLLAYAEQSARRAQAGPAPKATWWRRLLVPVSATAAVCVVAVIGVQVSKETNLAALPEKNFALEQRQAPYASSLPSSSAPEQEGPAEGAVEEKAFEEDQGGGAPQPQTKDMKKFQGDGVNLLGKQEYADWGNAGAGKGIGGISMEGLGTGGRATTPEERKVRAKKSAAEAPSQIGGSSSRTSEVNTYKDESRVARDDSDAQDRAQAEKRAETAAQQKPMAVTTNAPPPAEPARQKGAVSGASAPSDAEGPKLGLAGRGRASAGVAMTDDVYETESLSDSDSYGSSSPRAPSATRRTTRQAPVSSPLSDEAWAAYRRGDRSEEARLLRQALAEGVRGSERAGLLNRLCDAEFALGRVAAAEQACGAVVSEFPNSGAASVARKRLGNEAPAEAPATTTTH